LARDLRKLKFNMQKYTAARRGILFEFSFDQWWAIWESSGLWLERGRRKNQFVMARFGDKGPYALGNVEIITRGENSAQPQVGPAISKAKIGKKLGPRSNPMSAKEKEARRLRMLGRRRIWITNGVKERFISPTKILPKGWRRGRSKGKVRRPGIWITNGQVERCVASTLGIPADWYRGRCLLGATYARK
jgi:hypothetical protein